MFYDGVDDCKYCWFIFLIGKLNFYYYFFNRVIEFLNSEKCYIIENKVLYVCNCIYSYF